jgi:hypothetical protein
LNIPVGRLQPEQGFSLGRSTEISRDELKFQKFIDKLRRKFSQLILDTFKTQLVLKGICNHLEWEELKENIRIDFQKDNAFNELKEVELLQSRMSMIPQVDPYLGKFFSKEWVQRNVLRFSDDEIEQMNDEIAAEKGDPTAQPSMPGGMGMGGDPSMMGGDPNMMGGQPPMGDDGQGDDPFAQPSPDEDEEDQQFPFPKN